MTAFDPSSATAFEPDSSAAEPKKTKFDPSTAVPHQESSGIGDLTRGVVSGVKRVGLDTAANLSRLGGGLLGAVGASPEFLDPRFKNIDALSDRAKAIKAPESAAGQAGEFVGGLAGANPLSIVGGIAGPGQEKVRAGGSIGEGAGEVAKSAAETIPAILLGGELPGALSHAGFEKAAQVVGGNLTRRALTAGIGSLGLTEAERAAHNLTSPDDQQQPFSPSEAGQSLASGLLFGALRGKHETPASPPPAFDEQAATLANGVDQRLATPALPAPAERPDFVVNSRGQAVPPDQAAATAQGGPGFEQQTAPPPVAPNPPAPAPLALEHQPDITVDSRGRAVVNKGDRNLGQPFGGPGFDEQAPVPVQPAPPAGPLSRAAAAIPKPEGITDEREHGLLANGGVEPGGVSGEAASNAADGTGPAGNAPDLRQQYADRQNQIDALNTQRKTAGLSEAENTQLHDLRDEHDKYDALTGLLNQKGYDEAVKTGGYTHAAALDLDQFKPLNDTFGHQAGDLVLQRVAQVLHDSSGGDVTVARLHGDEYAGLAKGDPTEAMRKAQEALRTTPFEITYKDKEGNETTHELPGVGITFGVGSDYATADAAANAAKPKGGRRGTDTGQPPVRPADVQAAAGSATGVDENGRQDAVSSAERAGAVNDDVSNSSDVRAGQPGVRRAPDGQELGGESGAGKNRPAEAAAGSSAVQARSETVDDRQRDSRAVTNAAEPVTAGTGEGTQAAGAGAGEHGNVESGARGEGTDHRALLDASAHVPDAGTAAAELDPRENPEAFGLPPKPKSPVAGKPRDYLPGPRDFNEYHHDLLDFAALHGGLDPAAWRSQGVDPAQIRPGKDSRGSMRFPRAPLWRKGGLTPDALREAMVERGFLPPDSEHAEAESEANHAIDKVLGALNQGEKHYTYAGQETQAAIEYIGRMQEHEHEDRQTAKERGFESVEAMHAHDAGNFMRDGKPYDGSPREDIPFSKPGQKPGMSRAALSGAIHDVVSKWTGDAPRVQVLQSHDSAPPALRNARGFGGDVEGAYHNGTTYLFADAIRSPKRALEVLAHEAFGHYGMERAFAKQWPKLVSDIAALREKAPAYMRKVFAEVDRRYPGADAETHASETLAVMAEHGIHNALMDRVLATMRQFLRSLGLNLKFNDAELRQMLVAAKRRVEGEQSQGGTRQAQPAFAKRDTATTDMFGSADNASERDHAGGYIGDAKDFAHAADILDKQPAGAWVHTEDHGLVIFSLGNGHFASGDGHPSLQKAFESAQKNAETYGINLKEKSGGTRKLDASYRADSGDMFGGATSRDHVDAAVRAKEDKLSGKGAAPTMRQGAGELFAGGRPEQAKIPAKASDGLDEMRRDLADSIAKRDAIRAKQSAMYASRESPSRARTTTLNAEASRWNDRVAELREMLKKAEGKTRFSKIDSGEDKPTIGYPGDRLVQRERLAERKFDKPYAKLSADEKSDVDALFQTTSAARNPMFSAVDRKEADKTAEAIKQVAADNRENVRNDARAAFAQSKRNTGTAMEAVRALRDEFDKRIAAFKGDYKKLYAGISALERGEKTDDPLSNALWQSSHALLGEQLQRLNTLGADIHERVNYFSHIWKDQGRAVAEDTKKAEAIPIGQRRPLAGNKYYTKERVFETITDGLNAGREPISANPVDMFMARYAQGEKLAGALNIRQAIEGRGLVKPIEADRVPHGYARVNDGVFAGKALPELIARDLNNHLDPGLGKYKAWRDFRYAQNLLLSSRLGLSMFHAGMTTLDSMATHIDIGMRRAIGGDLKGAMHDLFAATRAPLTAAQELAGKGAGSKLVRQWYGKEAMDANTRALLDMAMEGGARARMDATDYNHSMTAFRRAWVQGDVRTQLKSAVPAAIEMTTHHIAQNLVPAQKMTARVLLLKFELDRLADKLGKTKGDYAGIKDELGVDAMRQIARKVNADVDDRLGQFAYENEFWNRILKDAAHAGIQSVGWNFGSLRLIGGGAADILKLAKPEAVRGSLDKAGELTGQKMSPLTNRLSYLITLNAVVAAMGAMTQYALTGQTPQETKDWFFPKTGRKNADDSDERLAFPSYVKDEYAFSHHPLQTSQHKLHPSLSMAAEMFENRDFYGNEIVDPEAPWPTEAKEFMQYLGKSFLPYSIQGAGKNLKNSDSVGMTVAPFFGVTPAPGDVTKSAFQQYISERYFESKAGTTKTPEQAAQGQALSDAINAKKAGQPVDTSKLLPWQKTFLNKPLAPLPEHLFEKMLGRSGGITFQQALHAYEIATPAERDRYRLLPLLRKTAAAKIRQLPPDEQQDARERLNALEK